MDIAIKTSIAVTNPSSDMNQLRQNAISRALAFAPFLARQAAVFPAIIDRFHHDGVGLLDQLVECPNPSGEPARDLRRWRGQLALAVALADLSGEADLTRVTHALSDFADAAVHAALTAAFEERFPGEPLRGITAIALGKQGSRELNYSSDIDPILLFDPTTFPDCGRRDPIDVAVRVARRWVELLSAPTADGYVLRVDLRLRPSPEATPIVLPVEAAISYYESQALAWEQAAFIRARVCAGDLALGQMFLRTLQPFIWRRSLDFGQIKRIGDISRRIRQHYAAGQIFGPGFDVKRGRGGIREVEFFGQVQQLIHGGRDTSLRVPATRDALAALATAGHIPHDEAAALSEAYAAFRTVEHRLQMVEDRQTHSMPGDADGWARIAQLHGLPDGEALAQWIEPHTRRTADSFSHLLGEDRAAQDYWPDSSEVALAAAAELGFADGPALVRLVTGWRGGVIRALRSAAARESLEGVLPQLLRAIAAAPDPDAVLIRFDALVAGLPSAIRFFDLIAAQPRLLDVVVAVLAHAPTLAADLAVRPELVEGLIDASVFAEPADSVTLARRMALTARGDVELHLDAVRRIVGEHRFALGVQLVEGTRDPLAVSRGYADIADAAIQSLAAATVAAFEETHGRIADGELVLLALGRQGGRALTHASDLDLILLFTGDLLAESDGRRPLSASTYFNRLGQRVIAALSVPTAAGRLYEVDTRLRPQGAQGPLVCSIDAFARYQREEAWTWEHMALTRARCVFGSAEARAGVAAIVAATLGKLRDPGPLVRDIRAMRATMADHKPPKHDLDVKLVPGGLVDCEFAIHAQQLRHRTGLDPRLNVALRQLVEAGLAPADAPASMDLLGRMLVTMRLMAPHGDSGDAATRARIAARCGFSDVGDTGWTVMLAAYAQARQVIGKWWASLAIPETGDQI
jgi:glutamate-ammonia-ligase adenylyltransferase